MNQKIAILTYPLNYNYGNLLQAFALIRYLRSLGYDVELIDKRKYKLALSYKIKDFVKTLVAQLFNKIILARYPDFYINKGFNSFIKQYINPRTKKIYSEEKLINIIKRRKYHTIIVGSDQIWRKDYMKDNIFQYFLSCAPDNIKKIAYSASFGVDYWQFDNFQTIEISEYLNSFSGISVREDSAVGLCRNYLNVEVKHTIDPTFLIDKDDYLSLVPKNKEKLFQEDYLFYYILDNDKEKMEVIDIVMSKLNLHSNFFLSLHCIKKNNISILSRTPVETWLEKMYFSNFVITDSYHGVIFAIIFNKPFIVIPNKIRGLTRFNSLLKMFKLEDRMIENKSELNTVIEKKIDWTFINSILSEKKKDAKEFIIHSIEKM